MPQKGVPMPPKRSPYAPKGISNYVPKGVPMPQKRVRSKKESLCPNTESLCPKMNAYALQNGVPMPQRGVEGGGPAEFWRVLLLIAHHAFAE